MSLFKNDLRSYTLVLLDRDGIECARVSGDAWLSFASDLARGYDREDAAQRGEPDPWSPEFIPWSPEDLSKKEWEDERRYCAMVGFREAFESEMSRYHLFSAGTTKDGDDPMHNNPILRHFAYDHLPKRLQDVSRAFHALAASNAAALPDGPEKDMCLRKLLEAKDCAVRAALDIGE